MLNMITGNWALKLLSLTFALLLWMFIMGERQTEVGYLVPLELQNLPAGMMVGNEVASQVDVRISGPRTLLMKVSPNDISITVDLTDLKPGLTTFRQLGERLNLPSGLRVTRLSPSFIDLKLERVKQKEVPVKIALEGEPLPGYQVGLIKAVPDRVIVEGGETELKSISEVTTENVALDGVNEGFSVIVPLVYRGTYTYLKEDKTTEVQVEIIPPEPLPLLDENYELQGTDVPAEGEVNQ